jgi:hypothetical protein
VDRPLRSWSEVAASVPHPNFAVNRFIYLSYSKPGATDAQVRTGGRR